MRTACLGWRRNTPGIHHLLPKLGRHPGRVLPLPDLAQHIEIVDIQRHKAGIRHNDSGRKADAGEGKAITLLFAGIDFYQSFMDLFRVPD